MKTAIAAVALILALSFPPPIAARTRPRALQRLCQNLQAESRVLRVHVEPLLAKCPDVLDERAIREKLKGLRWKLREMRECGEELDKRGYPGPVALGTLLPEHCQRFRDFFTDVESESMAVQELLHRSPRLRPLARESHAHIRPALEAIRFHVPWVSPGSLIPARPIDAPPVQFF